MIDEWGDWPDEVVDEGPVTGRRFVAERPGWPGGG